MPDANAIKIIGLTKTFKDVVAVNDVSLEARAGEIFGFLGHNGARKTTTIRMLLGLLEPTGGGASVLGRDIRSESLKVRH